MKGDLYLRYGSKETGFKFVTTTKEMLERLYDSQPYGYDGFKSEVNYYEEDEDSHLICKHYMCQTATSPDGCTYCAAGFSECALCGGSDCAEQDEYNALHSKCEVKIDIDENLEELVQYISSAEAGEYLFFMINFLRFCVASIDAKEIDNFIKSQLRCKKQFEMDKAKSESFKLKNGLTTKIVNEFDEIFGS